MKNIKLFFCLAVLFFIFFPLSCRAMPPGTLLYRTTDDGRAYGYSTDVLIDAKGGIIKGINPGHVAIYIGQENGEDYIIEALADGLVKMPARYFINSAVGEEFIGAKIPVAASPIQRAKAVALAKSLASKNLGYDFDFKHQKGPDSGEWTCVGLVEKIYESADIANPNNLGALEYDSDYYAVDITPDGFDNYSVINERGDCFSHDKEFSRIARRTDFLLPAPELIGFDAGLEYNGERYIFLPYTQFLQDSLTDVELDIEISSSFDGDELRGRAKAGALVLRWSLINNPLSSLKNIALKTGELAKNIGQKLFGSSSATAIVLDKEDGGNKNSNGGAAKTVSAEKEAAKTPLVTVNKADPQNKSNLKNISASQNDSQKPAAAAALYSPLAIRQASVPAKTADVVSAATTSIATATTTTTTSVISIAPSSPSGAAEEDDYPKYAIINQIYSTGNNDWVRLYNPGENDFDLAAAGYRLEKTKTADDPGLIMRIGNPADGAYPGGTVIAAHDYYLIVRDDANEYYKNQADAIAIRNDFSWTASGYTLYLGTGAISSSADQDIVDAVGFGADATYFLGNGPAPEIVDNYILNRLADNSDNSIDFDLILSDDPSIIIEDVEENATSTDDVATSTEDIATSTPEIIDDEEDAEEPTEENEPVEVPKLALINKIYATGNNDWLELYNLTDYDFDLAEAGYRLEKTKTAQEPGLIMRIGNTEDGLYPGGTIIKARESYLIVRDDANDYYKEKADAIATRDDFLWTGSGYTLYLGTGAISSSTDPDIIEAVGFGADVTYFQGNGPAAEIIDGQILSRVAFSGDNSLDFNLLPADDPSLIIPADDEALDNSPDLFVAPSPLESAGINNLWHFDECYGPGRWGVGKWGCAREVGYVYDSFDPVLSPSLDAGSFSLAVYYKDVLANPRLDILISNSDNDKARLILEPGLITVEGLPASAWRYYHEVPLDGNWHQAVLTVDQAGGYWAVYLDGREAIKEVFTAYMPILTDLSVGGDGGSVMIDELTIWNRPLPAAEIFTNYLADAPFSPLVSRTPQLPAELVYSWNFNEGTGLFARDNISSSTINIPVASWTARANGNYSLATSFGSNFTADFSETLCSQDLSLSFWWRNDSHPQEGQVNINLLGGADGQEKLFSLLANYYRLGFYFNNNYGILSEGINQAIPDDDSWHHLALVYDSYRYQLSFYVDGQEKATVSLIWFPPGKGIDSLKISTDSYSASFDDLKIWRGALSPGQVLGIYNEG